MTAILGFEALKRRRAQGHALHTPSARRHPSFLSFDHPDNLGSG